MDTQPSAPIPFPELPEGTVTFLFTDIEGSTQLLHRLRDRYATLLADQRRILRQAFTSWNGHEVDTQGDAIFVAFSRATQAVCATVEAQRKLAEHAWPEGVAVRVRMGIHTGEPWSGEEGYVGMDVHRAARIAHVGHGGQVLLSETTTALVRDELPAGVSLIDLGRHLLKDIHRPERICQLVIDGIPAEFPPLTSLEALPPEGMRLPRQVGTCPYRGLSAFQEPDAPFYFGRETFITSLEHAVREKKLVAVIVGSSGSGKSSALFAGLLPRLRKAGGYQFAIFHPGSQPFYALAGALLPLLESGLSETDRLTETRKLAERLLKGEVSLAQVAERILEKAPDTRQILLVVDQFEELYTLCPDDRLQKAFVDELLATVAAAKAQREALSVILLTMRADFMGQALAHRAFADALQEASLLMGPMTRQELHMAIEKPADMQGAAFEPGLVERILDDVGEKPGNLPLLEFTLTQLWEQQTDGWLTHTNYDAMGSVEGALATYADQVYGELQANEQELARRALVQLVQPGEGTEDTRRIATRQELGDESWSLIQRLADRRLVVTGRDNAGHETAEVVHEALIQKWGRFQEWMDTDRAFRAWQERLRGSLRQWQESNRDKGALLSGAVLALGLEWAEARSVEMNIQEKDFLETSLLEQQAQQEAETARQRRELEAAQSLAEAERQRAEAEQRRAEEQTRAAGRLRRRAVYLALALSASIILLLTAVWLGQLANRNAQTAQAQTRLASSRELAAAAVSSLQIDPERSVLLALQALSTADTLEARNSLRRALPELHILRTIPAHLQSPGVAYSPDGKRLASIGIEGMAIIWDVASGQALLELPADPVEFGFGIAFSPDGKRVAVPWNSRLVVWDAESGQRVQTFPGNLSGGTVNRVSFSPDSTRVAVANQDGRPRVWDLDSGTQVLALSGHEQLCDAIAFSPDGSHLATGDQGGVIKIWDAEGGQELLSFGSGGVIHNLAYSPDGARLAAANEDGSLLVWDPTTGQETLSLPRMSGLYSVAFMPDGKRVITAHQDGTTKIWDAVSGQLLLTLAGHVSTVVDVASSPDGEQIATAGYDGTIRQWDPSPGREMLTLAAHTDQAYEVRYSPDGAQVATVGMDGYARIWEASAGQLVLELAPGSPLTSLAYSPDGKLLAAGGVDGMVYAWDLEPGQLILQVAGHQGMVPGVAFSPDGTRLVSGSWDATAKVWEVSTGREIASFAGHTLGFGMGIAFSPDGKTVYSGGADSYGRQWETDTGRQVAEYYADGREIYGLAVSPDGRLLALGLHDGEINVWDTIQKIKILTLSGHAGINSRLAFSHDGTRLASANFDGLAKVWDVQSGQELFSLYGNPSNVFGVAISPDGSRLATAGGDGTLRYYTLDTAELAALARTRVTRDLTTEECQRYLHMEQCPDS